MSKTSSLWNMKILSNWKLVPSWSLKTKSFSYSECNENDFKTFAWLEILCLPILFHWSLSIPPGNIRKWKVFWYFQGVEKDIIDSKWVKISEMVNMKWNTKHERAKYKLLEVYWSQNTSFVRKSFKDFFVNISRTFFYKQIKLVFLPVCDSEYTAQKMKLSIKDFFSKCDQIRGKLQFLNSDIWRINTTMYGSIHWNVLNFEIRFLWNRN